MKYSAFKLHVFDVCVKAAEKINPVTMYLGWDKNKWDAVCKELGINFDIEKAFIQLENMYKDALMLYRLKKPTPDYLDLADDIYFNYYENRV